MSGFSSYYDEVILDHFFKGTVAPVPAKFVALFKSAAGLEDNNPASWTELPAQVNGNASGYERAAVANNSWSVASNSSTMITDNIAFNVALADWGEVSHVAIMDAATNGNVIAWGVLRNPTTEAEQSREILAGDQFILRENSSIVRLKDCPLI